MTAADREPGDGPRFAAFGWVFGGAVLLWAALIASFPLEDNSFFTHLATGRVILDRGSVPSADPYTFTAQGADWTVQSWLPSVLYAGAERLAGDAGLRVLVLVAFVGAAGLLWRLSRPATALLPRLLIVALAMVVAAGLWSERPYMVGVIGLAVVWLALEGSFSPWWLVPAMWLWANSHGSYPLAGVLILAVLAGTAIDRRLGDGTAPELRPQLRVLGATVLGILAAVAGPLGIDVLTFPVSALTQTDVFDALVEWQSPNFRSTSERAFLLLVLLSVLGLVRAGRWRLAVPAVVFTGAALVAQRNVVNATVVLVAVLACAAPELGTLRSSTRPRLGPGFAALVAAVLVLAAVNTVTTPAIDELRGFPARSFAWIDAQGADDVRLIGPEVSGNLLEVLDGPGRRVFVDDRADMFPSDLFEDAVALEHGSSRWAAILDRHGGDVVVWERGAPLAALLAASPDWRVVHADTEWVVACRRAEGCGSLGS